MSSEVIDRQANFFYRIIGTTLIAVGLISAIAQIVKFFSESEPIHTTALTFIFSILLIVLGTKQVLLRIVNLALVHTKATKIAIFSSSIVLCLGFILLRISLGYQTWRSFNTEGGFIEYGTSLAFLLAAIFAFPTARYLLRIEERKLGYFYYLLSAGFFLVGMEEISWGQKLIGWQSSDFFEAYNSQSETTLHNLIWVNEYMDKGLMYAALIAGISWLIYALISKFSHNYRVKYVIPRWFLSSFFLIVFIFFYLIEYQQTWNSSIATFQEAMELVFSLGCLCFVLTNFFTTIKQ